MGYGQFSGASAPSRDTTPRYVEGKRVRQTFGSHANTAHTWAQQKYPYGRSGDGRIFFHGPNVYSYGTHFCIASFTDKVVGGKRVVFLNADKYSPSTGKHQGEVRGALRGLDVITIDVADLTKHISRKEAPATLSADAATTIFESYCERLGSLLQQQNAFASSRDDWRKDYIRQQLTETRAELDALRRALKIKRALPADPRAWLEARRVKAAAKARAVKIERAKLLIKQASGYAVPPGYSVPSGNVYSLRTTLGCIQRDLKQLRSARLILGKTKFPKLVANATAVIRQLEPCVTIVEAAIRTQEAADYRRVLLNELDGIASGTRDYFVDRLSSAEKLHKLALEENRPEDARKVLELAHRVQWESEINWRAPHPYARHYSETCRVPVTPEQWQNGAGSASYYAAPDDSTLIRRKGNTLETSRGASAPWSKCVGAFLIAQHCRATGTVWQRNGVTHNLGTYELDRVAADGTLKAGCHLIAWPEILRLAVRECPEHVRPAYPLPVVIGG